MNTRVKIGQGKENEERKRQESQTRSRHRRTEGPCLWRPSLRSLEPSVNGPGPIFHPVLRTCTPVRVRGSWRFLCALGTLVHLLEKNKPSGAETEGRSCDPAQPPCGCSLSHSHTRRRGKLAHTDSHLFSGWKPFRRTHLSLSETDRPKTARSFAASGFSPATGMWTGLDRVVLERADCVFCASGGDGRGDCERKAEPPGGRGRTAMAQAPETAWFDA